MKKYDIYGIGHALVDLVFEVDDPFLSEYKIEKGQMSLVDEARQTELMAAIPLDQSTKQAGGSAANTLVAASQLGSRCYYACKVANDDFGAFYLDNLRANGVHTRQTATASSGGMTGKCLVMVTPDAERTMNTFLGINSEFSVVEIDKEALRNAEYFYSEGYLVPAPSARAAMIEGIKTAQAHGVKVALSFSDPSMVKFFRPEMEEVLAHGVDLLFCNEEEALIFTGKDHLREAREVLKKIAKKLVITLGSRGAMVFDGENFIDIAVVVAEAIDTNGAGDMFAGTFLYGLTQGYTHADAGKLAAKAAAEVVTQWGPRLPNHQLKGLLLANQT